MNILQTWHSDKPLPGHPYNLADMLNRNADVFGDRPLYQEVKDDEYVPLGWNEFRRDVVRLQSAFAQRGLGAGDRVAILSPNRREMLELELAVMAMGAVAVPIFAGYPSAQARVLVDFCDPVFIAVADAAQYQKIESPEKYRLVVHFDDLGREPADNAIPIADLIESSAHKGRILAEGVGADTVCLMMYTSGTMGKPKCVQLTHRNILSQQAAMRVLWQLDCNDRVLSYLPWHHSFGGIFEKYAALCNGAVLALEHGYGKDIDVLLANWKRVRPTVFFSVPRVYHQIATRVMQDPALERVIFHDQLRFIFTAAAPLPKNISDIFESRGVPIYEGWGLTETSPCCTITDPSLPRQPGVVGKPIPGVSLALAEDNEILTRGPNTMRGYFRNAEATDAVLRPDGWFATGDVGEFCETGLRLISRKDRIFKLSNAEKVVPTEIENLIVENCCYLSHAFVTGSGRDYPVALLFPNRAMLSGSLDHSRVRLGCNCPPDLKGLSCCLAECLARLNDKIEARFMRPAAVMLVDHELSIAEEELTPSMKMAPNVVASIFKAQIEHLYSGNGDCGGQIEAYVLKLVEQ